MREKNEIKPIEVFRGTLMEAEIVKSLLENAEIIAFLQDENMGFLAPWNVASGGVGSVKIIVSSEESEKAKIVVDEYLKNYNSDSEPDPE